MFQVVAKTLIIFLTITLAYSQFVKITYYQEKSGSCPPPLLTEMCSQACFVDEHCQGTEKCCPTTCGGSVCSKAAAKEHPHDEKPGSCPKILTGRRICSSTCAVDSDCHGSKICCKNRCGALTCQLPEVKPKEINEPVKRPNESRINEGNNINIKTNNPPSSNYRFNPNNPFLFPKN